MNIVRVNDWPTLYSFLVMPLFKCSPFESVKLVPAPIRAHSVPSDGGQCYADEFVTEIYFVPTL